MLRLGLVGHPIGHSLSPWIHQRLMDQQNINGTYDLFDIDPDKFDEEIQSEAIKSLDGFNVTVPYKEKIIPFLDDLDDSARALGAVNTVKHTSQGWIGYNTDGVGFVDSLLKRYPDSLSNGANVLILGGGGAARGIFDALVKSGVKTIDIANRTTERAQSIIGDIGNGKQSRAIGLDQSVQHLKDYDVIIQTSTVGMSPDEDVTIIPLSGLKAGSIVSDIVYRPVETLFLKQARAKGAYVHFGHEMLLQQAVYAFKIWTDTNPESDTLLEEFEGKLKGV